MDRKQEQFRDGEQIGKTAYRVTRVIGSGGMGCVYEVEHLELGRRFVLKALHGHLSGRNDLVARMKNEWRALAKLHHPNIVQVTDAGQTPTGLPFYVMEKLEGRTLGQLLAEEGRLSIRRAGPIICDVLSGLDAAHEMGAIHRDIKPQNIFVQEGGTTKLLDFGIAKLRDSAARVVTAGGISIGTPRFMAPEQAEGTVVDGRADIYAAALVLYEALVGRGPFAHIKDPNELVMAHIGVDPERADFMAPSVPEEMGDLLVRWLSKSPSSRPPSAGIAASELRALVGAFASLEQDESDVTLGGDYDASTVGVDAEAFSPLSNEYEQSGKAGRMDCARQPRLESGDEQQGSQGTAEDDGGEAALVSRGETFATQTVKPATTHEGMAGKGASTLGWGTELKETGEYTSGARTGRSSVTPPPVQKNSARSARAVDSRVSAHPGRATMIAALISALVFIITWQVSTQLSFGSKDETAAHSEEELHQSGDASVTLESSASMGQAERSAATPARQKPLAPEDEYSLSEELSPQNEIPKDTGAQTASMSQTRLPSKKAAASASVSSTHTAQALQKPSPAPPVKSSKTAPPRPEKEPSEPALPGSGLW